MADLKARSGNYFRMWPKAAKALTAILCDQSTVNFHLLEFILAIFV